MVHLTRLNGERFVLNADAIQQVEAMPDTVITLLTGEKLLVREPVEEIIGRVVDYKRRLFSGVITPGT